MPSGPFAADAMDGVAATFDGRLGFYVEDLRTGESHGCRADERFPAASVCKIPVLVELFRQVAAGRLSLDERRRLAPGISTHGSGTLQLTADAPELSLYDYARLMMAISDNMATDMLMQAVGVEAINAGMDELGYPDLRTGMTLGSWHYAMCHMEDLPCTPEHDELFGHRMRAGDRDFAALPFTGDRANNVAAPRQLGRLLAEIHAGRVVAPDAGAAMLDLLALGTNRTMIPRHLRPEVSVAHKYGSSGRIKGDAGIVDLPTGPLVIAAFALGASDAADGAGAIADIGRLAVASLSPESLAEG